MKKALITLIIIAGSLTLKAQTKPDTTVIIKIADYRRLIQIIQQQATANDAQKLLMNIDLNRINGRVREVVDTVKTVPTIKNH